MTEADADWEAERILATRGGDVEAFGDLVQVHQGSLRGFMGLLGVVGEEVEDLAQETFIIAFNRLADFDPSKPVGPWLRGIARNLVMRRRTQQMRQGNRLTALRHALAAQVREDDDLARIADLDLDRLALLRRCLHDLPATAADLIRRRYTESQNASDIAAAIGKSAAAVRMMLGRIREALRSCVEGRRDKATTT